MRLTPEEHRPHNRFGFLRPSHQWPWSRQCRPSWSARCKNMSRGAMQPTWNAWMFFMRGWDDRDLHCERGSALLSSRMDNTVGSFILVLLLLLLLQLHWAFKFALRCVRSIIFAPWYHVRGVNPGYDSMVVSMNISKVYQYWDWKYPLSRQTGRKWQDCDVLD